MLPVARAFDAHTTEAILSEWRHTDGGPASDFLEGWSPAALVVSIAIDRVARQGPLLGIWATTSSEYGQLDRIGRPLTGNALLGTLATDRVSDKLKEEYNRATPATAARFVPEIEKNLGLYDGFDGKCGNQLAGEQERRARGVITSSRRYSPTIDSGSTAHPEFARNSSQSSWRPAGQSAVDNDCGGRTPTYSAANVYRSLLANGTPTGIDDGLTRDKREHSSTSVSVPGSAGSRQGSYQ